MSKTVVLIHGYGFDYRSWYPVEPAFDGFHIIYLSLPGFGDEPVEEAYSITELAKGFWSEIDPNIAPEVHLVGHSMGGYVCMEMIAQQPGRVLSLALIHSHIFADTGDKKASRTLAMENIRKNGCQAQAKKMIPSLFDTTHYPTELVDVLVRRGIAYGDNAWFFGMGAMRDRKDHSETFQNISFPVLMLMGENDTAVPLDLVYKQAPLASQGRLCIYPGVGHMAMYEKTARMICDLAVFYTDMK
jgi:pimeloyl-ACP methyl ester carboxylesterase